MIQIDRRLLLRSSLLGLGAAAVPGWALAPQVGFTHHVASGEPGPTSILLWTRFVGKADESRLRVELSERPDFARIAGGGDGVAQAEHDHIVKITVTGLTPDRWYHYRFIAPDGTVSPVGRTRTLPVGETRAFNLGVFSCSNIGFGYFNAYGHAAARRDIDLMLHLGDYQYEYRRGEYPDAAETPPGRLVEPAEATVHLAEYRARYAAYRRDPSLQALHARFPMILMWDDHESANDSWEGGAEHHDPATDGPWSVRKAAAVRAYREWMPVSDDDWAEYRIGDLAALFRPEERLTARTKQLSLVATAMAGKADLNAALARFRDGPWSDPAHTLMGPKQEAWFAARMQAAAKTTKWQVFAQQVNVGLTRMPDVAAEWLPKDAAPGISAYIQAAIAGAKLGLPFNMDSWNGYPAARSRMLKTGLDADANLVVLSGDSHNAWAFDLIEDGAPAGVEFGGHSVTSPGYESELRGVDPARVATALVTASPELRWADTARRGYMTVALTPERVTTEWLFLDTIRTPSLALSGRHRASVRRGARRLEV
ncbi:MAG TPA: alkaline phosphatase D family protein [Sphingomonas sp.]|jgi:alkaline phosphatase D|uniref:alkaline phosphatase D family protein n=1 Tax=Sphingomonas sp. TaxID=28214 RepID=UPI002EDA800C